MSDLIQAKEVAVKKVTIHMLGKEVYVTVDGVRIKEFDSFADADKFARTIK